MGDLTSMDFSRAAPDPDWLVIYIFKLKNYHKAVLDDHFDTGSI